MLEIQVADIESPDWHSVTFLEPRSVLMATLGFSQISKWVYRFKKQVISI